VLAIGANLETVGLECQAVNGPNLMYADFFWVRGGF